MDGGGMWLRSVARAVATFSPNNAQLEGISDALRDTFTRRDRRGGG